MLFKLLVLSMQTATTINLLNMISKYCTLTTSVINVRRLIRTVLVSMFMV